MQGTPTRQLCFGGTPLHGDEGQAASLVPGGEEEVETSSQWSKDVGPEGRAWGVEGWRGQLCSMHKHVQDATRLFLLLPRKWCDLCEAWSPSGLCYKYTWPHSPFTGSGSSGLPCVASVLPLSLTRSAVSPHVWPSWGTLALCGCAPVMGLFSPRRASV